MGGREKKLIRAAIRACYEALAELDGPATGRGTGTPATIARALRALIEGQIAALEALAAASAPEDAGDASGPVPPPPGAPEPPPAEPLPAPEPPTSPGLVAAALEAFPLEELNRWLASGTVFQIRGALAYLNMQSMGGQKIDEMRGHIRRMGYSDEMGRLETEGMSGAVLLFRRPD